MKNKALILLIGCMFGFLSIHAQDVPDQMKQERKNIVKELNMTPEQEKEYIVLKEQRRNVNNSTHDSIVLYRKELDKLINEQNGSKEQIFSYIDKIGALKVQTQKENIEFMFGMKEILSPEQYAKYSELKNERKRNGPMKHKGKIPQSEKNINQ